MRPFALLYCVAAVGAALAAACAAEPGEGEGLPAGESAQVAEPIEGVAVAADDVAILFPLGDGLWPASRVVPADVVDRLGEIVAGDPNSVTYASLRVVSMRLEPCFVAAGAPGTACERQIRFVLQPVVGGSTLDAAIHVIHALPSRAFGDLARGIVGLRPPAEASATARLGVHPVLAAEGLGGAYARGLERVVFTALESARLARVTFMGLRGRGNEWQLGGVTISSDGAIAPLPIPSSGARIQSIVLQRGAQTFVKSISPSTAGGDDVSLLFDSLSASAASPEQIGAALRAANRIENPDIRSSEDTDCATCHAIGSSRAWAEKTFARRETADRYAAGAEGAEGAAAADLGVLRALGYFGTEPVVSTRALNDTAKAVTTIRAGSRGNR